MLRDHEVDPRPAAAVAAAVLLAVIAACSTSERDEPRPNLVLIVVDTLRADHLSAAGYPRQTSPHFDRLAERGTLFERFYSHSAITRPSVATLFTSRFISGHGISNQGPAGLSAEIAFLPEILSAAGYRTRAFVTNPQIHPLLGFARGFDRFEKLFSQDVDPRRLQPADLVKLRAHDVFSAVRRSLQEGVRRPFFLYVHLLDPHGPYQPPEEEIAKFADPSYQGDITGALADFGRHQRFREHPEDLEHFRALYDAEVSAMDQALGEFVEGLEHEGLLAKTHLLITADHGEEFMEHGATGHSTRLYEESIRVPLLWIGPGVARGRRVDAVAGLVDVLPTLIDVLDLPVSDPGFRGRSLSQLWADEARGPAWRTALFLEGVARGGGGQAAPVVRGIVTPTHKVLARGGVAGRPGWETLEIFDLTADPGEEGGRTLSPDLGSLTPAERQLIRLYQLEEYRSVRGGPESALEAELPAADLERLRSLGYVDP